MLRKFKIKVDGKEYLVEMEEIGAVAPAAPVAPAPVAPAPAAPASEPAAEASPAPAAPVSVAPAGADAMPSPMPGTIMILEAMKMENEIVASKAGVVSGIHVANGQVVNPGDALITIN